MTMSINNIDMSSKMQEALLITTNRPNTHAIQTGCKDTTKIVQLLSVADNYVPNMQGVQISAGYLLGQELLYLLGVGAGETIGDRHLPAVGFDDDVGKKQSRFE